MLFRSDQTTYGFWQFLLLHGLRSYSSMGFLFKGNTMLDGSYLSINVLNTNFLRDFIIEKNYFNNLAECGIVFASVANTADGVLILNNTYDTTPYSTNLSQALNSIGSINKVGACRYISLETSTATLTGDVNGDGKISLKDATLLRYYLLDEVTLTAQQLANADMDGNGNVSLNDINLIRKALLN